MKEIQQLNDKKLVDYLNIYSNNVKIGLIFKHGVGDILMFLPYFDYLKSLYKNLVIHLLIIRDNEEQLYEKRDDLVRIDKDEKIYENYDYLFELNFRNPTVYEMFNDSSFTSYKPELCFEEEIGLDPKVIQNKDVKLQEHKTRYIGFTFNRIGNINTPIIYNVPYEIAKYMWLRTKQLGFIPIEIVFMHPDYINVETEQNRKYDFIDRTTRDLAVSFENMMSVLSTLRGFATIDCGYYHIAQNYFAYNNVCYLETVMPAFVVTKDDRICKLSFRNKDGFTDEKFVNWLLNCDGEKL